MRTLRRFQDCGVEIVHADLDAHAEVGGPLSPWERAKAARFRDRRHGERYAAGRRLLRRLLAERLGSEPEAVSIVTGPHGKPRLAEPTGLHFNLAHSGADALFAFSRAGDVGIDLERVRRLDPVPLARSCFSSGERRELLALDPAARLGAFFAGWVRKEAVVKADGRGLSLGLESFTVTLGDPARVLSAPDGGDDARERWELTSLDVGPGLSAAVAVLRG